MAELGQIEKPRTESFTGKRKLYCVSNIYPVYDPPDDFKELFDRYWNEVDQQIEKLEVAGKVKKIFCEMVYTEKEEMMEILGRFNERVQQIVKKKLEEGGTLLILKDEDRAKLQFPGDIEVFLVTPPSYDDIMRWFREKWKEMSEQNSKPE